MIAGIDEAGRGSLIGPLVVALVIFPPSWKELDWISQLKDSKLLSKKRRKELFNLIKAHFPVYYTKISPKEIDTHSINKLEEQRVEKLLAKACEKRPIKAVYIDLFTQKEALERRLEQLRESCPFRLIAEHKADRRYRVVSAASIVAKVIRDRAIEKLKEKYGDFGSGYPADERTIAYMKKNGSKIEEHVRKKWKTAKRFSSSTLKEYL